MECLQKIWKSLCLLNPDSWAKVYTNWASFLITSMWEVLWGRVVNRASQSLEIRHIFGYSYSGWKPGPVIVRKKLPFCHWGWYPTNELGSSSVARTGFNRSNRVPTIRISHCISTLVPVAQHTLPCVFPNCFWCSLSLIGRNEVLSYVQRRKQ